MCHPWHLSLSPVALAQCKKLLLKTTISSPPKSTEAIEDHLASSASLHQICCHAQLATNLLVQTCVQHTQSVLAVLWNSSKTSASSSLSSLSFVKYDCAIEHFQLSSAGTPTIHVYPFGPNVSHLHKFTHTYTQTPSNVICPSGSSPMSQHWVTVSILLLRPTNVLHGCHLLVVQGANAHLKQMLHHLPCQANMTPI